MDNVMVVYKKVRILPDGNCYPLFIDNKRPFQIGQWMHCEFHPTRGFAPRSIGVSLSEARQADNDTLIGGWHCCYKPVAPHLADQLKSGERRVWLMCEARGKSQRYERPESQGGAWLLVEWLRPLAVIDNDDINEIINNI